MAEKTKIAWADSTASPWFGCTEASPGCLNCYARELTLKNKWAGWGDGAPRVRSKGFEKLVRSLNRKSPICDRCGSFQLGASVEGLPWCKECGEYCAPRHPRIFPSLMDFLDPKVPVEWLADFLRVIQECQNLDFLLLTKRPELWMERISAVEFADLDWEADMCADWTRGKPPSNVWVGTTVEDHPRSKRIRHLSEIPARVRFLSCEPLLSDIRLGFVRPPTAGGQIMPGPLGIHWVIVGGESGKYARPCHVEWIRSVVGQCKAAQVPIFVKQVGSRPLWSTDGSADPDNANAMWIKHPKGGDKNEWPEDLRVQEFPKV